MATDGCSFETDDNCATGDNLYGLKFMRENYQKSDPKFSTRVTVPVLWDTENYCIVCNESSEIIRMFNSAFAGITGNTNDYWPVELRDHMETINATIYSNLNNGVYKSGFATNPSIHTALCHSTLCWPGMSRTIAARRSVGSVMFDQCA